MLKVIIIDDEYRICQMITVLVDWEKLGFEVAGTASNSVDALALIAEREPDVVITDVRMPGMSGIELIEEADKFGLDIDFIIISGYKHFEYAHSAIKQGVEHYLLKPIDEEELTRTLQKIRAKREKAQDAHIREEQLASQMVANKESLRAGFLNALAAGEGTKADIEQLNKQHCCNFKNGLFQAFVLRCDKISETQQERQLLIQKLTEAVHITYMPHACDTVVGETGYGVTCLLNFERGEGNAIRQCHEKLFEQCKRYTDVFGGYHITLGLGGTTGDTAGLAQAMHEAVTAVKSRILYGTDRILSYTPSQYGKYTLHDLYAYKQEGRLSAAIENNSPADIDAWFADFASHIANLPGLDVEVLFAVCGAILETVAFVFRRLPDSAFNKEQFETAVQNQLYGVFTLSQLLAVLRKNIEELAATYFGKKSQEASRLVRTAKQYISENYAEQIKLEDVARLTNYNPSYFSSVFKQEVGMNFSEYLAGVRMDAAKQLLRSTNVSINSISYKVGYKDEKHFSKLFRKVVGVSPTEYRKLYK